MSDSVLPTNGSSKKDIKNKIIVDGKVEGNSRYFM